MFSATLINFLYFKPFIDEKYIQYFKCQDTRLEKSRKMGNLLAATLDQLSKKCSQLKNTILRFLLSCKTPQSKEISPGKR